MADNSGAKVAMCIGVLGAKKVGKIGKILTVSIKTMKPPPLITGGGTGRGNDKNASSNSFYKVKKGEIHKALVVRTKATVPREDGRRVRFDDNAVILLTPDFMPLASRIYGPIAHEIKERGNWAKVLSLASKIL